MFPTSKRKRSEKMQTTKTEWISRWAGSYTFISCSYWALQYSETLKRILGHGFNTVLFIHKQGTVSFFVTSDGLNSFGKYVADKTQANESEAIELLQKLKQNTDIIMNFMNEFEGTILTSEQYALFYPVFERHLAYHNFMKKTVDFLSSETLERLLPLFTEARKYSEAVYSKTELFFRSLANSIAIKECYDPQSLTCLTQQELEIYLESGVLPHEDKLKDRFHSSIILFEDGKIKLFTGHEVTNFEKMLFSFGEDEIKGTVAFQGKVRGICRLIYDPFKTYEFNNGDILVTGMTRPEFTPFIKKAGAIVTDVGGILCHAAITAREMKIPCIVGAEKATKVFKEGDIIEVDAEIGIIRKIPHNLT